MTKGESGLGAAGTAAGVDVVVAFGAASGGAAAAGVAVGEAGTAAGAHADVTMVQHSFC